MSSTRRRSTSWMKELIRTPHHTAVAPLDIPSSSQLHSGSEFRRLEINENHTLKRSTSPAHNGTQNQNNVQRDPETVEYAHARALEHYFRFLHCVGLAPIKEFWKNTSSTSYSIYKIFFWIFSCLGILDSIKLIKLGSVMYVKLGDLYRYTTIGRHVLNCVKRINLAIFLSSGSRQVSNILNELRSVRGSYVKQGNLKASVFSFGMVSLVAALLNVIFRWASLTAGWSPTQFFLDQSHEISLSLFVWTTNDTKSNDKYELLQELYGEDFTPATVVFGVMGIGMEICGLIMEYVAYDIMFFSALTLHKLTNELQQRLNDENSDVEDVLKQYKQLQNVSKSIETAFGGLFKISHASNLLSCAYFLLILLSDGNYHLGLIFLVLRIAKVWITCYLASKSSAINKSYRQWVRNAIVIGKTLDYERKLEIFAVLDESMEFPVGLGSDAFFIDETFVLKFATMIGTFLLFLVDFKKKSENGEL